MREGELGYVGRDAGLPQVGGRVEGGPPRVHHMQRQVQDGALGRRHQQVLARDTLLCHRVPVQTQRRVSGSVFRSSVSSSSFLFSGLNLYLRFIALEPDLLKSNIRTYLHTVIKKSFKFFSILKVPSHQIRLGLKCYGWIDLGEYKDLKW